MDSIDEANKAAYLETKARIKQALEKAKLEKLAPKGACYNCDRAFKSKSKKNETRLFCDTDCRDDFDRIKKLKEKR